MPKATTKGWLKGARLGAVVWAGMDLEGAVLTGCDLTGADLQGTNLTRANLEGAILAGCNVKYCNLEGAFYDVSQYAKAGWLCGARLGPVDWSNLGMHEP